MRVQAREWGNEIAPRVRYGAKLAGEYLPFTVDIDSLRKEVDLGLVSIKRMGLRQ
jgi:hypothetical protein